MPAWTTIWRSRSRLRCSQRCCAAGCPFANDRAGTVRPGYAGSSQRRASGGTVPRRVTNLLLLVAVVGLAGSGLYGWVTPDRWAGVWYQLHHLLGALLVLTLFWKTPIVRGSLNRRLARP